MMDDLLQLTLHPSEFPEARRAGLEAALRERRLPVQLLYLSLAQAERWLRYHAAWSPSRTDDALQGLYAQAYAAAVAGASPSGMLLVGLGSGGGSKDALLLAGLARHVPPDAPLHYAPVDASAPLVAEAALHVREAVPAATLHPLVADLSAAPALEPWLAACGGNVQARVFTCFGVLPNLDPVATPRWLAGLMRPADVLLVSLNLSPGGLAADGARILLQYDNAEARAWYLGALGELGLSGPQYTLGVEALPLPAIAPGLPADAAWRIGVSAALRRQAEVSVRGVRLELRVGERLAVFNSLRCTEAAAVALLEGAGLAVQQRWIGANGEEGIFLCRRA